MRSLKLFLVSLVVALLANGLFVETVAASETCYSVGSGNWNDAATWNCGIVPGANDAVYVESGHTVTLTQNASVGDLHLNSTTGSRLALGTFSLSIYGKMRAFTGAAPGTSTATTSSSSTWINSSSGGHLRIVGNTRTVFNAGEWGANPPGWTLVVAMNTGQTALAQTNVKAGSITIESGTFEITAELRPDAGTNSGELIINSGATLVTSGRLSRTGTANVPFGLFTSDGTFRTSSGSPNVWPDDTPVVFSADSTVEYNSANSQTIQTPLGSSYGNLLLGGSNTKIAPSLLQIRGDFTNHATFDAATNSNTTEFTGSDIQEINGSQAIAFYDVTVNLGASVIIPVNATAASLTNNGRII